MFIKIIIFAFALAASVAGDVSEYGTIDISDQCVGCICEAATNCNTTIGCRGDVCGPFQITWGYWSDSGKPTLDGQSSADSNAYANCVNNWQCAGLAVRGYMAKFGQDCNNDGKIDCDDFVRIHFIGGYGCSSGNLQAKHENAYRSCRSQYPA